MREIDVHGPEGRTLHAYDGRADMEAARLVVVWHHGTPNIGLPPEPLFGTSRALGIAWVGYDRPGYGGSDPHPGRDVGSAAEDVAAVADVLGIDRFAVMGHSGGGPHALACAALLRNRVAGAVVGASLAPYGADGLDWFAGMGPAGQAGLRAALEGRPAKERFEADAADAAPDFVPADWQALQGEWSWFGKVVGPALRSGPAPLIDDDLAYVAPWGFDPATISAPVLVLHGQLDRVVPAAHGAWLAERIPSAKLRRAAGDGHISVLRHAGEALEWLARTALEGR